MNDLTLPFETDEFDVHPLADIFPMLGDDELAELAEDIKANGLQFPIILDATGAVLVDGRNRLAACKLAGVEPRFERLNDGEDAAAFIVSVNLARRHMSVGQRAMALAMIYPEPAKAGRRKNGSVTEPLGVAKERLSLARAVLRVAPDDLVPLVLSGARTLDAAFTEARRREQDAQSDEAKLRRLKIEVPDVAALVVDGSLTLAAGLAELDERARYKRVTIEQAQRSLAEIVPTFEANVAAIVAAGELGELMSLAKDQKERLHAALALLKTRRIG